MLDQIDESFHWPRTWCKHLTGCLHELGYGRWLRSAPILVASMLENLESRNLPPNQWPAKRSSRQALDQQTGICGDHCQYFVASTALKNHHMQFNWQPLLHMGGDNTSANCWSTKFSNSNKFARRLTKLLAMAQKNLGIDVIIDHVIGLLNGFADAVSRGEPSVTLDIYLKKLKKDFSNNAAPFACLQVSPAVKQVALKHS